MHCLVTSAGHIPPEAASAMSAAASAQAELHHPPQRRATSRGGVHDVASCSSAPSDAAPSANRPPPPGAPVSFTAGQPLPPLLPRPPAHPLYTVPCHASCTAWLPAKAVLPALHAVLLLQTPIADSCGDSAGDSEEHCSSEMEDERVSATHATLPHRLAAFTRLLHALTSQLALLESNPQALTAAMNASQQLQHGVVQPSICALLPQLYASILHEMHAPDMMLREASSTDAAALEEQRVVSDMWTSLLQLLSFLVCDAHFAMQFSCLGVDSEAIMSALLARVRLADPSVPTSLAHAVAVLDLLAHCALPSPFLLSFLAETLQELQGLLLRTVREAREARTVAQVLRHALSLLGSIWSRGMPFFLARATSTAEGTVNSYEQRVVQGYQQAVSLCMRVDWLAMYEREQQEHQQRQQVDETSSATSSHSGSGAQQFVDSCSSLHRYASFLARSWPHPHLFHAGAAPVNGAGLVPLADARDAPAGALATLAPSLASPSPSSLEAALCAPVLDDRGFLQLALSAREQRAAQWHMVRDVYTRAEEAERARAARRRQGVKRPRTSILNSSSPLSVRRTFGIHAVRPPTPADAMSVSDDDAESVQQDARSVSPSPEPVDAERALGINLAALARIDLLSSYPAMEHGSQEESRAVQERSQRFGALSVLLNSHRGKLESSSAFLRILRAELARLREACGPEVDRCIQATVASNLAVQRAAHRGAYLSDLSIHQIPFLPLSREVAPRSAQLQPWAPRPDAPCTVVEGQQPHFSSYDSRLCAGMATLRSRDASMERAAEFGATDLYECVSAVDSIGESTVAKPAKSAAPGSKASAASATASPNAVATSSIAKPLQVSDWSSQVKQPRAPHGVGKRHFTLEPVVAGAAAALELPTLVLEGRSATAAAAAAAAASVAAAAGRSRAASPPAGFGSTRAVPPTTRTALLAEDDSEAGAQRRFAQAVRTYEDAVREVLVPSSSPSSPSASPSLPLLASSLPHAPPLPSSSFHLSLSSSLAQDDEPVFQFTPWFGDGVAPGEVIDPGLYCNIKAAATTEGGEDGGEGEEDQYEDDEEAAVKQDDEEMDSEEQHNEATDTSEAMEDVQPTAPQRSSVSAPSGSSSRRKKASSSSSSSADDAVVAAPDFPSERSRLVEEVVLKEVTRGLGCTSAELLRVLLREMAPLQIHSVKRALAKIREMEQLAKSSSSVAEAALVRSAPPPRSSYAGPMDSEDVLNSFESLFCRRCYTYDCAQLHSPCPRAQNRVTLAPDTTPVILQRVIPNGRALRRAEEHSIKIEQQAFGEHKSNEEPVVWSPCANSSCHLRSGIMLDDEVKSLCVVGEHKQGEGSTSARPWSTAEQTLLRQLYFVARSVLHSPALRVAHDARQPAHIAPVHAPEVDGQHIACRIAALLGSRTCKEVAVALEAGQAERSWNFHGRDQLRRARQEESHRASLGELAPPLVPNPLFGRMSNRALQDRMRQIEAQHHDLPLHFEPCSHAGAACTSACPCVSSNLFCETSCGCADTCANRFMGCKCVASRCGTMQCPCFQAQRECDPNVCRSCECEVELDPMLYAAALDESAAHTAAVAAALASGSPAPPPLPHRCGNVALLSGRSNHVLISRSATHGWGLFLGPISPSASSDGTDPSAGCIAKHRLVAEYRGEILSHEEADRRGKIYDFRNRSYLFNLNDHLVVDAARKGTKAKFANHSSSAPNLYPRILLVQGTHRIGLFARRKLIQGEELLFDYKHEHDVCANTHTPTWFKQEVHGGEEGDDGGRGESAARKVAAARKKAGTGSDEDDAAAAALAAAQASAAIRAADAKRRAQLIAIEPASYKRARIEEPPMSGPSACTGADVPASATKGASSAASASVAQRSNASSRVGPTLSKPAPRVQQQAQKPRSGTSTSSAHPLRDPASSSALLPRHQLSIANSGFFQSRSSAALKAPRSPAAVPTRSQTAPSSPSAVQPTVVPPRRKHVSTGRPLGRPTKAQLAERAAEAAAAAGVVAAPK